MAVAITIVCLVVLLELQTLDAADDVKGPKVTEKVSDDDDDDDNSTHVYGLLVISQLSLSYPVALLMC